MLSKNKSLEDFELKDLDVVMYEIVNSLDLHVEENEFAGTKTFGELCDRIVAKMEGEPTTDCTSQQAFYKLRYALSTVLKIDRKTILTESSLEELLPVITRRSRVNELEQHLGFKLHALRPPDWISLPLGLLFVVSLFFLMYSWQMGLTGMVTSLVLISIANRLGNELCWKTVGELAEKAVLKNYTKARRKPTTYNPKEVEQLIIRTFSEELDLDESLLTRNALLPKKMTFRQL